MILRLLLQESNQTPMEAKSQEIVSLMTQQYYNYIRLLKITNNFEQRSQMYSKVKLQQFSGKISVVGTVSQIDRDSQQTNEYFYPVITTTISQQIFSKNQNIHYKMPNSNFIKRRCWISAGVYNKKLAIPFNKIISCSKKQKDRVFVFTNLKLLLRNSRQCCFGFTDQSYIIQAAPELYQYYLEPLQISLLNNYAELSFENLYQNKMPTFLVPDIKRFLQEKIQKISIIGVIQKIFWQKKQAVNPKQQQVLIQLRQNFYFTNFSSIGVCKIYIRYENLFEQQIKRFLQEGWVYALITKDIVISENINLVFKILDYKNSIIKIAKEYLHPLQDLHRQMEYSTISALKSSSLLRNRYKFRVDKLEITMWWMKVYCQKCGQSLIRQSVYEYLCRGNCGKVAGKLQLWITMTAMDETGLCELSIQGDEALSFFKLQTIYPQLRDQALVEQTQARKNGNGMTYYFKKHRQRTQENQMLDGKMLTNNQVINKVIKKCLIRAVSRSIIAVPKASLNESLNSIEDQTKQQYQNSFSKVIKDVIKKNKIFLNGCMRLNEILPCLKVITVLDNK